MQTNNNPQYPQQPYPPQQAQSQFYTALTPKFIVEKAIRRISNLSAAALLAFNAVGVLLAIPLSFIVGLDRVDLVFLFTLACNGIAGFIALYCIFSAVMRPLNCRDDVGKAFGKPVDRKLFICAVVLGFALAMASQQLTGWLMLLLENLGLPSNDIVPDILPEAYSNINIAMLVLQIAVSPALLEEFAFRGVLMQSLRRYGDGFAIVVSAVVFGVFHGNIVQAPFAFLLGLTMGWLAIATGSVWTSVVIHLLNNLNSVFLTVVEKNMGEELQTQIYFVEIALSLLLGTIVLILFLGNKSKIKLKAPLEWVPKEGRAKAFFTAPGMVIMLLLMIVSMIGSALLPLFLEWFTEITATSEFMLT